MVKKIYILFFLIFFCAGVSAQIVWSGSPACASGSSTAWLTAANWCGGVLPGSGQNAQFNSNGVATLLGIDMTGISVANKTIGAIEMTSIVNGPRTYQNSSTTVAGAMVLNGSTINGVPNTILRNNSPFLMTITTAVLPNLPFGISLGNTTENVVSIDATGGVTINVVIKDSTLGAKKLVKAGTGSGVLTLAGANTYTGGTTLTGGNLTCGAINTIPSTGTVTLSGGVLRTGATAGFNQSAGPLNLANNTNLIFGTGVHTLNFANSSAVGWTVGSTLTISGWTGGYNGTSGTSGRLFIGSNATGLTAAQLSQIVFFNGVSLFPAAILSTGEVVPGSPTINVTPTPLTGFVSLIGPAFSAEQTYVVDGSSLTNNITITPPVGFQVSLSSGAGFITNPATLTLTQTGGVVPSTTIYVRQNSATLGPNTGSITHTSTGSNNPNVALTGNVIAAEPTVQSSITFGTITNTTIDVNFSGGNGAKRILLVKTLLPVSSNPVDATNYTASVIYGSGSQIGTGNYVVYNGTGNSVTVTGLTIGTIYHFAVYEYNDGNVAGAANYLIPGGINNATTTSVPVVYTWIGGSSTWTTAANWLPARIVPAFNDILLFMDGTTETVTGVPNETIGQLHVSLGTHVTLQPAVSSTTLTIGGGILSDDLTADGTSSLNISGANTLTIAVATGATAMISGTMTFTNAAHKIITQDASGLTFTNGSVFTAGTGFSSNPFGPLGTTPNSVIFSSGSRFDQVAGGNPFVLIAPASIVVFQTGSLFRMLLNQLPSLSGRTYADLEINATGFSQSSTGGVPMSVDNLTITQGTLNINLTGGVNIKGNVSVAGGQTLTFTPASASTLTFNGTIAQNINNAGTLTFGANLNVTMNNTAGLTLNTPVTLLNSLTLTAGNINTSAANLLTMGAASSVTGASNASFVFGPVKKVGNTAFIFPVGKANGYVPIRVSNFTGLSTPTDQFTAEYVRASGTALGPNTALPAVNRISSCEYWNLNVNAGAPTVDLTLYWNANNPCNGTYISNVADIEVVHFDGAAWNTSSVGFSAKTGTTAAGDVTWTNVSAFSPFTIASSTNINPLPITINYFNGTRSNGNHLLNWKVTCISTPGATIEIERSADGRSYSSIYSIFATAVRCEQPFNYTDNQPAKGINYYRLKMTDVDGKITYSTIVTLINAVKGIDVMNIAPNPIVNGSFNVKISSAEKIQMELVIADMQGRVLQKQSVLMIAGFNQVPMHVKNLAAGTYQLFGNTADGRTRVLRFVIQ